MNEFYKQMLSTASAVGLPIIGRWKAAQILFIVYAYGGAREEFTHCPKFLADVEYIQKTYGVEGAETPDAELASYIQQLNEDYADLPDIPEWADKFCRERYGFSLINVGNNFKGNV